MSEKSPGSFGRLLAFLLLIVYLAEIGTCDPHAILLSPSLVATDAGTKDDPGFTQGEDVIVSSPILETFRERRTKRFATGEGMKDEDEFLLNPVFVPTSKGDPLLKKEGEDEDSFLKHLWTSTVSRRPSESKRTSQWSDIQSSSTAGSISLHSTQSSSIFGEPSSVDTSYLDPIDGGELIRPSRTSLDFGDVREHVPSIVSEDEVVDEMVHSLAKENEDISSTRKSARRLDVGSSNSGLTFVDKEGDFHKSPPNQPQNSSSTSSFPSVDSSHSETTSNSSYWHDFDGFPAKEVGKRRLEIDEVGPTTTEGSEDKATSTEKSLNPIDLLDEKLPVDILPIEEASKEDEHLNATTTKRSTEEETTAKTEASNVEHSTMNSTETKDEDDLMQKEEALLEDIRHQTNQNLTTTEPPITTNATTSDEPKSGFIDLSHQPESFSAFDSTESPGAGATTTTRTPSLIIEGRRRIIEKIHRLPSDGPRWRMTQGEVLAVVLGTVAAVLVILGVISLMVYRRMLGLKFGFQFQRQSLNGDHSGSNNGSSHSPEEGSGSSPPSAGAAPSTTGFGLGQLSSNLSRGLGLGLGSSGCRRNVGRSTSLYGRGGNRWGVAAYSSDGHSNHHIDLGQGNMDDLNFQPAYMARNLESPREGAVADDFSNLDNDSFLNSLEFVNIAKINSQFGHTKL